MNRNLLKQSSNERCVRFRVSDFIKQLTQNASTCTFDFFIQVFEGRRNIFFNNFFRVADYVKGVLRSDKTVIHFLHVSPKSLKLVP